MLNGIRLLTIILGLLSTTSVLSQVKTGGLAVSLTHQKVALIEGKEQLVQADSAKPGEVIEYRATYRNRSAKPLQRVEATVPIPMGTEVLPVRLQPGATASLDGVRFEAMPLKRKVKRPDGKEVEQLVPYAEYRYLRWNVGALEPGKSAVYAVRVKVNSDAAVSQVAMNRAKR